MNRGGLILYFPGKKGGTWEYRRLRQTD